MYEISVKARFSGAHHLKGHNGPCGKIHGHNWQVEVFLRGTGLDSVGMLADFHIVKSAVKKVLSKLDHEDLNSVAALRDANPTSENLAKHFHDELSAMLDCPQYAVFKVRVSETEGTAASYWKDAD